MLRCDQRPRPKLEQNKPGASLFPQGFGGIAAAFKHATLWWAKVAQMPRFPVHPSYVRPSSESSRIHGAVLGSSMISGVEDDREISGLEMRAPVVMKRLVSPTQAELDEHYPLLLIRLPVRCF